MEKSIQTLLENYVSIYGRPKKGSTYTDGGKAARARIPTRSYYNKHIEKESERKRLDYHNKQIS